MSCCPTRSISPSTPDLSREEHGHPSSFELQERRVPSGEWPLEFPTALSTSHTPQAEACPSRCSERCWCNTASVVTLVASGVLVLGGLFAPFLFDGFTGPARTVSFGAATTGSILFICQLFQSLRCYFDRRDTEDEVREIRTSSFREVRRLRSSLGITQQALFEINDEKERLSRHNQTLLFELQDTQDALQTMRDHALHVEGPTEVPQKEESSFSAP